MSNWNAMVEFNNLKSIEDVKSRNSQRGGVKRETQTGQIRSNILSELISNKSKKELALLPLFLAGLLMAPNLAMANQVNGIPEWRPQSSEKLVKLPSTYLKKSIDSDFADSKLGMAIETASEQSRLKIQSLTELKDAVSQAEGEVKTELRHQLLAEKRSYINIMSRKNEMRWKQLMTKQRLFERMLKKLGQRKSSMTASKKVLIEKQAAARKRFDQTVSEVDLRLFETKAIPESIYSRKYSKNLAVINQLLSKVNDHRMNKAVQVGGRTLSKQEYIQQLLTDTQSEISILEQEEAILGYMAKLVSLDALTLSEETLDAELSDSDYPSSEGPARAAAFFFNN